MGEALLIVLPAATALLLAASVRLTSLVSTFLAAYLAFVGGVALVVLVLSPFHRVTRGGLAVAETILFAAALAVWYLRGRPRPQLGSARSALRRVVDDPIVAAFLTLVVIVLGYELVLALAVPPNNWDSLTYHLSRVAAWLQHGGVYWVPNAPDDRINEFQPLAEQEILYLFVATGGGRLFALAQYLGEIAILIAVYGTSRRLGFDVRASACASFVVASFSLVALEATTAQNDLVAASFPAVAVCLILGGSRAELTLAGAALGLGAGAKLTTVLVWPVLAWLVSMRGRGAAILVAAGGIAAFLLVGMWGFVLNTVHTGHVLGHGGGRKEWTTSPSFPGSLRTGLHVVYRALDPSVLSDRLVYALAGIGLLVAIAVAARARRSGARGWSLLTAGAAGIPLVAPLLVIAGGATLAFLTTRAHIPVHDYAFGANEAGLNHMANEDDAAFGPVGSIALLSVPVLTVGMYRAGRADTRQLALAAALPCFLILLSLQSVYNPWLTRFLVVPMVLTAPLFAWFFGDRAITAAILVIASVTVGLTLARDLRKPLTNRSGPPWELTWNQALMLQNGNLHGVLDAYRRLVPAKACVGALLQPNEPSYLLYGPKLAHHVVYLPVDDALPAVLANGLYYVVISRVLGRPAATVFTDAGWRLNELGRYWLLVVAPGPGARTGAC